MTGEMGENFRIFHRSHPAEGTAHISEVIARVPRRDVDNLLRAINSARMCLCLRSPPSECFSGSQTALGGPADVIILTVVFVLVLYVLLHASRVCDPPIKEKKKRSAITGMKITTTRLVTTTTAGGKTLIFVPTALVHDINRFRWGRVVAGKSRVQCKVQF